MKIRCSPRYCEWECSREDATFRLSFLASVDTRPEGDMPKGKAAAAEDPRARRPVHTATPSEGRDKQYV